MGAIDTAAKTTRDQHPADVVAAIHKAGTSLRQLSIKHGYHPQSLQGALRRPYPRAERLIAARIGVPPQKIWPSRYHLDGSPKSGRNERGIGRHARKDSTRSHRRNVYRKAAR